MDPIQVRLSILLELLDQGMKPGEAMQATKELSEFVASGETQQPVDAEGLLDDAEADAEDEETLAVGHESEPPQGDEPVPVAGYGR